MTKNNLKEIRTKIGLTQEQLADMIGTSGAYISQLETGSRNIHTIRQSTINRLCEALGCKEEDLFVPVKFQYNEEGKLIIDSAWHDPHFPTGYVILIDGSAFLYPMGRMFENGQDAAKVLRPLKFYMMDENNKNMQSVAKYEYSLLPFDPKSGIEVTIGRAIAKDELELIRAEYNITDDDMSDTFVDTKGSVYGKKYMKEYTCVQIRVSAEQARELEEKLMDKGIEAGNIAPGRVNIRVE